jgi:hypothetical protein
VVLVGGDPADGAPGAPPAGPPPSTTTAPFVPEDARIEDAAVDDPAALEPPDDSDAARDGERSGTAPSGASGAEAGGGAAAERDVLERFLDRLRERPPEPEDAARTGEAAGMGQDDDPGDRGPAAARRRPPQRRAGRRGRSHLRAPRGR